MIAFHHSTVLITGAAWPRHDCRFRDALCSRPPTQLLLNSSSSQP
jgi:hypothetical protein